MRIQQLPYGDAVCRVSPLNKPQLIKETLEWKSTLVRDPLWQWATLARQPLERRFKVNQDICQFVFAIR